jgi:hypothetical protein
MKYGYVREGVSKPKNDAKQIYEQEHQRLKVLGVQEVVKDSFADSYRERSNLNTL